MIHENIVIFTSQFCIYDRKTLLNSGLYFAQNCAMGLYKHIKRTQADLKVFALLKDELQKRQGL
jgi:hypothetical protein